MWKDLQRFYKRRAYQPAWFSGAKGQFQQDKAEELMAEVAKAPAEGLEAEAYDIADNAAPAERRSSKREKLEPRQQVDAELRLSYSFMKYATHLLVGRVDPKALDKQWVGQTRQAELPDLLEQGLSGRGFSATFDGLRPRHPQYDLLKRALQRYREIAAQGGWPTDLSADGRLLKKGTRGPSVAALRTRLQASGDLELGVAGQGVALRPASTSTAPAPASDRFDESLAKALARFEARHGLEPDGALDKSVVAALNVPVEERIRAIELNLERWRWLPEELGGRFIMVNIPGFKLQAFDGGRLALEMRVVTGTQEDPTPILSDQMTHVIFSPYWNIPPTIAREEWLPKLQKNPDYLAQNGVEVVKGSRVVDVSSMVDWNDGDLRLRQRPGARNALGLVKFAFPNRFNVYLHDTPNDSAFYRASRDLSHGCVRVEKPLELAEWVLGGQSEWTRDRIDAAMHAGTEKHVKLDKPIPVYLMYQTAWAADDGTVLFVDDLYGHDSNQLGLMEGGSV